MVCCMRYILFYTFIVIVVKSMIMIYLNCIKTMNVDFGIFKGISIAYDFKDMNIEFKYWITISRGFSWGFYYTTLIYEIEKFNDYYDYELLFKDYFKAIIYDQLLCFQNYDDLRSFMKLWRSIWFQNMFKMMIYEVWETSSHKSLFWV